MIINLRTIPHGQKHIELVLDEDWWHSDERNELILAFDTPFQIKIKIYKPGDKYVLDGELSGRLKLVCDRCLEVYHQDLRSVFEVFLALPLPQTDKTEVELIEEDMDVDFITGEEVDLDEIIKEQIYLSLPIKCLCKEDCLGLCPSCGSNLNRGACQCHQERGHPAFLKLKSLKIGDHP